VGKSQVARREGEKAEIKEEREKMKGRGKRQKKGG
jgi:hypothetical protein